MSIYDAIAEQAAAKKGLRTSVGKIGQAPARKRTKTYTEKQHLALVDQAVNEALEEACNLIRLKLGINLGKSKEATQAIAFITQLKR